jgi:ABC-type uncharacterized transport system involved in gliding motility auxiliary subunit
MFLVVVVLAYQIVGRYNQRFDLTKEQFHSVTKETAAMLREMKQSEIAVKAFFAEEDPARRQLEVLLKGMAVHHPKFHYEFYDPDRSPSEAKRHRIDNYRTILIQFEERRERINEFTEEGVTNALIRLGHAQKRTLCFTVGHGEISLAETTRAGFSDWKQVLTDHQFALEEIQVAGQKIPSYCTAVVMAGARYELLPKEIETLQKFPETGKGLFLLIDPMDPGEGKSFSQLVQAFGLELGEDVVVDKASRVFGGDYLVPLVSRYAEHPVTEHFDAVTFLPVARTVRKHSQITEGVEVTELAFTSPESWAERNLKKLEEGEANFDPKDDLEGPLSLAAAVELVEAPQGARVVVVGDSDLLTNAHLPLAGNRDFALNLLEWLTRDERWIAIRPKMPRFEPLFLKVDQSVGVAAFTIGGLPLSFLVVGAVAIWRRRREA